MIKKVLIANRGEIAVRVIIACHKLGLKTVAIYSTADKDALHTRIADEAICIGPGPASESYLNIPAIFSALFVTGSDAIHPGYGFLAENAKFANLCEQMRINYLGPDSKTLQLMGDKYLAKLYVKELGLPVIPGSNEMIESEKDAEYCSRFLRYPLLIKAVAGGGGRGMRLVNSREELKSAFMEAKAESIQAFGCNNLYLEQLIKPARHIEVQILGDGNGQIWTFPERACSIQKRRQKIIEETPAPKLKAATRTALINAARKIGESLAYRGLGTVEFLLDKYDNFYFMEMNTRVQVEHSLTEVATKVDLIAWQLWLSLGNGCSLSDHTRIKQTAIEVRLYAEDPKRGFSPISGHVDTLIWPKKSNHIRIDTALEEGILVTPYYDHLLAKVITSGSNRAIAIRRMRVNLKAFRLEGFPTNLLLIDAVLSSTAFQQGNYDIAYVEDKILPYFTKTTTKNSVVRWVDHA